MEGIGTRIPPSDHSARQRFQSLRGMEGIGTILELFIQRANLQVSIPERDGGDWDSLETNV